jgi:fatty-acyl-CoA synthase
VVPGSGERGRVAIKGYTPIGYYKDEEKSAKTFMMINGVRYSIPGDWAEVELNGTVKLLGRGSQCINTGGEKVYPEEVEETLKRHADVEDVAVVGIPHERFGESIVALVQPRTGSTPQVDDLISHTKEFLAAYKAPRSILFVESVNRAPNGKLDYRALKDLALSRLS